MKYELKSKVNSLPTPASHALLAGTTQTPEITRVSNLAQTPPYATQVVISDRGR